MSKAKRTAVDDAHDNLLEAGKPVEASWTRFIDTICGGDELAENVVTSLRYAYFAGALAAIKIIAKASKLSKAEGNKLAENVRAELKNSDARLSTITVFHPDAREMVGDLPDFLNPKDPRPARVQFDENYQHGGGWRPIKGFTLDMEDDAALLRYPGDPPMKPLAGLKHGKEIVMFYPHAFVAVVQPDGSLEVARLD